MCVKLRAMHLRRHHLTLCSIAVFTANLFASSTITAAVAFDTLAGESLQTLEARLGAALPEDRGRILIELGGVLSRSDLDAGHQRLTEGLALAKEWGDSAAIAVAHGYLCVVNLMRRGESVAVQNCDAALASAEATESHFAKAKAHSAKAQLCYQTGNLACAEQAGTAAVHHGVEYGSRPLQVSLMSNMGLIARAQGNAVRSLDYFRNGLALLDATQDPDLYTLLNFNMGLAYLDMGEFEISRDFFTPALEWARETKRFQREFTAIVYLSAVDVELGNAPQAETRLQRALLRDELRQNEGYLAFAYAVLGDAQFAQQKYTDALVSFTTGLEIANRVGNTFESRRLDIGYARTLSRLGERDRAAAHLEQVRAKFASEDAQTYLIEALGLLANIRSTQGNYKESLQLVREAEQLSHQLRHGELEQQLAAARANYEVEQQHIKLMQAERDTIVRNGVLMLLIAAGLIGYLFISRRMAAQKNAVQAEYARELEKQVQTRTEELQKQVHQLRAAEEAQLNLERQLAENEKLRVLGQLTGGVAHDFNNLLTVVLGAAELLKLKLDPNDAEYKALVDHIMTAADSGADITKALMAYARKQPMQLSSVNLHEFFAERISLITRTLGGSMEILYEGHAPDAMAVLDPAQLTSAVINLCLNAREAQNDAGVIRISLTTRGESWIVVTVEDSGSGMTEEQIQRAIEPFYTTKTDKGTGLGLSMVYGFSKQLGGELEIESKVGVGTKVSIVIPASTGVQVLEPRYAAS